MNTVYEFLGTVIATAVAAPALVSGTAHGIALYFEHHPQQEARLLAAFDRR